MVSQYTLRLYVLGVLVALSVAIWYAVASLPDGTLRVVFLDVGQGDAIFIEAPNGNQMLIDGGPPDGSVLRELSRVMPLYDRTIDVVIATHPDNDHTGGLAEVLRRYRVAYILEPGTEGESASFAAFRREAAAEGAARILARRGQTIALGAGVRLDILFPDRDVSGLEANASSVVARLSLGESSFLFTGDSPRSIETYLAEELGAALQSDVLKAGHHGSRTSSAPVFVRTVAPRFAVISAGKDNRYGHPHEEVVDLFKGLGIPMYNTAEVGRIEFVSFGAEPALR